MFEKIKQRRRQIIEHKLQKVKDKNLLKNWRNMYSRRSQYFVRKSMNPSSSVAIPGNSVSVTAPFGMGKIIFTLFWIYYFHIHRDTIYPMNFSKIYDVGFNTTIHVYSYVS